MQHVAVNRRPYRRRAARTGFVAEVIGSPRPVDQVCDVGGCRCRRRPRRRVVERRQRTRVCGIERRRVVRSRRKECARSAIGRSSRIHCARVDLSVCLCGQVRFALPLRGAAFLHLRPILRIAGRRRLAGNPVRPERRRGGPVATRENRHEARARIDGVETVGVAEPNGVCRRVVLELVLLEVAKPFRAPPASGRNIPTNTWFRNVPCVFTLTGSDAETKTLLIPWISVRIAPKSSASF